MTTTLKTASLILAALALSATASAGEILTATAEPGATVREVQVRFAPADLSTPTGAARVWERIKLAAHQACAPAPERRSMPDQQNFKNCIRRAATAAVTQLNAPLLSQLAAANDPTRLANAAGEHPAG